AKVSVGRFEEKRQKRREHTVRSGGIGFDSNDAGVWTAWSRKCSSKVISPTFAANGQKELNLTGKAG
ncbi:MAG: hypothetical protein ACKOZN_08945, partial [Cyanobium sp.]